MKRSSWNARRAGALLAACAATSASAADWLQFGYDPAHSGNNSAETTLSAANVAGLAVHYELNLSANVDSTPVFLSAVAVAGGTKDLLFFLSGNGQLRALDAATGDGVWSQTPVRAPSTNSSPAIDPDRTHVYAYGLDGRVHKYLVADGTETTTGGWPEVVTMKADVERVAASLSIATSAGGQTHLYVTTASFGSDAGDYQGHLVTIDLASGVQRTFNAQCSNLAGHLLEDQSSAALGVTDCPQIAHGNSGIWGRPGAVYDAGTDRVFFAIGNGLFDAKDTIFRYGSEPIKSGFNWGDSVLALAADGGGLGRMPVDSYTPANFASLQAGDKDLGSVSPALLPAPAGSKYAHLAVQGGKDATLRLLNLADLSGHGAPGFASCSPSGPQCTTSELQVIAVPQGGQVKAQPAVWVDTHGDGATWVFVATASGISALKLVVDGSGNLALASQWSKALLGNTTSPVIANDVLYAASDVHVNAFDPKTGAILWTSVEILGGFHWQSPIVVGGRIYLADNSANLWAFALP